MGSSFSRSKSMAINYEYKLIFRVLIATIFSIFINLFYIIFFPLTYYPIYYFFKILNYNVILQTVSSSLIFSNVIVTFIEACIAASAYYLLLLLIVATKDISFKDSVKMFLLGSLLILILNIVRIIILIFILLYSGTDFFNAIHIFFWQFISTIYVAGVWIFLVWKFKVKNIPIYSDLKYLYERSLLKKK